MLTAAAKLLSGMKFGVLDVEASVAAGKAVFYEPAKVAEQARSLAGENKGLLDELNVIGQPGQRAIWQGNCYWNGWRWICMMKRN